MKLRFLGLILSAAMILTLTPTAAFAVDPVYDDSVVATIKDDDGVKEYESLKDAVNVADGKTIVLQKNCAETVEVKKSLTFAIDPNKYKFTGAITVPDGFMLSTKVEGATTTYIVASPIAGKAEGMTSISGSDAPQTSVEISKDTFPNGCNWAIIACNNNFADAMSATGLAGTLDCPILTTDIDHLNAEVLDEIYRLGVKKAYIIGGKGAIPADVEGDLSKINVASERIYGHESWDTSVKCADKIAEHKGNSDGNAIVSTSLNFQDALSMSSYAYKYEVPIFLTTDKGALPVASQATITSLKGTVYVAGGKGAVPNGAAENLFSTRVVRIAGMTGYDTSNQIAIKMRELGFLDGDTVCVASGAMASKGLDALSGSSLAGRSSAPILLVNGEGGIEPADITVLKGVDSKGSPAFLTSNAANIKRVFVLGGLKVIPIEIRNTIEEIIGE